MGAAEASLSASASPPGTCVLTYRARTRCHELSSRRASLRYWRLIAPFVDHIERACLLSVVGSLHTNPIG